MSDQNSVRIFDISPPISEKIGVFPGDVAFERAVSLDFKNQDNLLLSSIRTTLHVGAHTDGPNHYSREGHGIDEQPLRIYMGAAQVMTVKLGAKCRIRPQDLPIEIAAPRILFRTLSYPDPNSWNDDFVSLSSELVEFCAHKGVILVGIDTPSIDLSDDKILESHQAIARNKMAILEGIDLSAVPDGRYFLNSLPLRIEGADASPVRAILIAGSSSDFIEGIWSK